MMRLFLGLDIEDSELLEKGDGSYTVLHEKRTDEQKAKDAIFERRNNNGVLETIEISTAVQVEFASYKSLTHCRNTNDGK